MVDCGNTRCAQERRSFKKDLLSWSKKVPLLLGLEAIAVEFDDKNIVESLLDRLNCLEDNKVVDWEPEENCFYCQSPIKFTFNADHHVSEDGEIIRGPNDTDVKCLQELLPFCPQFYTRGAHLNATELLSPGGKIGGSPTSDDDTKKPHVELKIPAIRQTGKLKRDGFSNGKKAYTEHELLAAVHDIRSGKIGTRRASVLYGIPRSTLRNKIFKMDNEQKNLNLEAENEADNLSEEPSARIERTMCLNDLMSQPSMFSFMPPLPFGLTFSTESNSKSTEEWEKKLEHIRKKHNLSGDRTEIYNGQHSVADMSDGKMNHTSCLPFNHELKLPILPELVKKLTGERLQMEHGFDHIRNSLKTSVGYNEPNNSCEPVQTKSHSLVNLKIPSYKSVKAEDTIPSNIKDSKPYENSRIGETLKNIIAKTITEKVRSRNLSSSFESFQPFPGAPQDTSAHQNQGPGSSAFSVPCASPPKRQKRCTDIPKKSQGSVKNCMSPLPSTPVKKTRPKRGQYRKYNSQLLMEAVRAVQRGEMSVHRAGSYFGVPHSTLEYKVKERHLLRQKKIKEAQALKDAGNGSNTTSANSSDEEEANISPCKPTEEQVRPLSPTNQASASEWLKLYSSNIPPVSANNMAFYNSGFALNTPASELLRKLQHKVQSKANNYRGDDGFSAGTVPAPNGIGPLGGGFLFLN